LRPGKTSWDEQTDPRAPVDGPDDFVVRPFLEESLAPAPRSPAPLDGRIVELRLGRGDPASCTW